MLYVGTDYTSSFCICYLRIIFDSSDCIPCDSKNINAVPGGSSQESL